MLPAAICASVWFHALGALVVVGSMGGLYRLRTWQIANVRRAWSTERLATLERRAAELQDALLQSSQGLVLTFQGLSSQLEPRHPLRTKMEAALDEADQLLELARKRAWDQLSIGTAADIGTSIQYLSEELLAGSGLAFSLLLTGWPRPVRRSAATDICQFARQALLSVLTTAHASAIEVEIEYGSAILRIRVRDDGSGLSHAPTHIRELARRAGANLYVWTSERAGTEMELVMAGDSAYR